MPISSQPIFPTSNPTLKTIHPTWSGNPLDPEGRYRNLTQKSERSYRELMRWQFGEKPQKAEKKMDTWQFKPRTDPAFWESDADGLVWLGHASFLFRLGGQLILTDPVLGNCGPIRRRSVLPFPVERLRGLDYILLSHNHRDHADRASMKQVIAQNPQAPVLTGLRTGNLLRSWAPAATIQEAGWWQQYETGPELEIYYLPAMHWARRGLTDLNDMLWGSYMLRANGKTVFFGADSGYDVHFQEISRHFPDIDVAMLGIGAYSPQWFMKPSHTTPEEAVQAFRDLGAAAFVPMHYGTFDLSDEPFGEPYRRIQQAAQTDSKIKILEPGSFLML